MVLSSKDMFGLFDTWAKFDALECGCLRYKKYFCVVASYVTSSTESLIVALPSNLNKVPFFFFFRF